MCQLIIGNRADISNVFLVLENFDFESIHDAVFDLIAQLNLKNGQLLWPIRTALSGKQFTPGGGLELACLLGKSKTIERIASLSLVSLHL